MAAGTGRFCPAPRPSEATPAVETAPELAGCALLSVGHRPGLEAWHHRVLVLEAAPGGAVLSLVDVGAGAASDFEGKDVKGALARLAGPGVAGQRAFA